jgi:hypothetical protein
MTTTDHTAGQKDPGRIPDVMTRLVSATAIADCLALLSARAHWTPPDAGRG